MRTAARVWIRGSSPRMTNWRHIVEKLDGKAVEWMEKVSDE
jgi:hypothetical protein